MSEQPGRVVGAACDGACSGNPGPGGWGALLRFEDGSVRELGGSDPATTNNRMELSAALALLELLKEMPRRQELVIRTDSRYLIDGMDKWLPGWKRRSWRTASGGPVLNRDLWERLDQARLAGVGFQHVRGHSGDPDNDRCDAIAVAFSRGQRPPLAREGRGPSGPAGLAAPIQPKDPSPARATAAAPPPESVLVDAAPPALRKVLSRLELADRLARGGYSLSLVELAQLVEVPLKTLESRSAAWLWRDWWVEPSAEGRWRLRRDAGRLDAAEGEAEG
jgi:ribonuclease HI